MTTPPTLPLSGFRYVQVQQGDTLQIIAARALNDASRWATLIAINGLAYPYLTGDPSMAGPAVLLYGSLIKVPASGSPQTVGSDPTQVFGTDIALDNNGNLVLTATGDLQTVTGVENLSQALTNRIRTWLRELLFHLAYGCGIGATLGKGNGPTTGLLGAAYVSTACRADPRVLDVVSSSVTVSGDKTAVTATIQPIVGSPININQVI